MHALFGLINSPLYENTRSTGADVAGEHKMMFSLTVISRLQN